MSTNRTSQPSSAAELQQLVGEWRALRKVQPEQRSQSYRELVRYASDRKLTAATYRLELETTDLDPSRISNLCKIVGHATACEGFAQCDLTYGAALKLARGPRVGPAKSQSPPQKKLERLWRQLVKQQSTAVAWTLDCGLFQLHFVPEPPAPVSATPRFAAPAVARVKGPRVVVPISPETAEKLDQLALRSGLNRAETAAALVQRGPWAGSEAAQIAAKKLSAEGTGRSRRRGLQRRQHPTRAFPDLCRLPIRLPRGYLTQLETLSQICNLRVGATANLLLEPDARRRITWLPSARAAVATARQKTIAPDPFPDLSVPENG